MKFILLLFLASCASTEIPQDVTINDIPYCGQDEGGFHTCFWVFKTGKFQVPNSKWSDNGRVSISGKSLADIKNALQKLCSEVQCNYHLVDITNRIFQNTNTK